MRHPDFPSQLAMPAWHASLRLRFAARAGRTALVERRHQGPLLVQKPLYPEGGICHVVVLHPPAGVAGGDRLDIDIAVEAGAHAVLATPGATKWYKSLGREAAQQVRIEVADGARLDWLPQENIVFDDARARIATDVVVAPTGSAIGWDAVVLGRQASGERWSSGALWLDTRVAGPDRALWIEQSQVDATSPLRPAVAGMDGLHILGTLWAVGQGATPALAETLAEQLPYAPDLRAGVTCLAGAAGQSMLLLRVLGRDMEAVRRVMTGAWATLRAPIHGVAARPLRLWAT
ncbi:urease accessory protein [Cupriavidus sp. OV038]|jgi:urease accessory protein|uniref:urease accessory protein UreD n=1 Tax=unclassified Cupriavidus TaxID=2640874 RepID=UPI0008E75E83|nr:MULTISPECIES: urease accessory protein UreD [unclassified Cupriavidus]SFC00714.1 urease accessory protein [Cupriavidus sp. OV038]SFO91037.1 urease accessory protein [Cupriavidus sp. OV096]